jgi:hypothetical protein
VPANQLELRFEACRRCCRCHATKPLTEFHVFRLRRIGRQAMCKSCTAEREKERSAARRVPSSKQGPCRVCWDLAHRRPESGCPKCGLTAMQQETVT